MAEQIDHYAPARLSPVPIEARPSALPYGLTWDDLRPCLPGFLSAAGAEARTSHAKQGLHRGANSRILTLHYAGTDGVMRSETLFFKHALDASAGESAKYRFLASCDIPTPRLLHVVERGRGEVVILEFLPRIGIEPADADELLVLLARLNAVRQPPRDLFQPNPGLPAAEFDALLEDALTRLASNPTAAVPVDPRPWLAGYRRAVANVAGLPVDLNHGEFYFQQVGWSDAGGQRRLVLFDLETMSLRPRFTDLVAVLDALATRTGRDEHDLFDAYLAGLRRLTGCAMDERQAWTDMLNVRVVAAFESLPWLTRMDGHPEIHDTPADAARRLLDDMRTLDLLD